MNDVRAAAHDKNEKNEEEKMVSPEPNAISPERDDPLNNATDSAATVKYAQMDVDDDNTNGAQLQPAAVPMNTPETSNNVLKKDDGDN